MCRLSQRQDGLTDRPKTDVPHVHVFVHERGSTRLGGHAGEILTSALRGIVCVHEGVNCGEHTVRAVASSFQQDHHCSIAWNGLCAWEGLNCSVRTIPAAGRSCRQVHHRCTALDFRCA